MFIVMKSTLKLFCCFNVFKPQTLSKGSVDPPSTNKVNRTMIRVVVTISRLLSLSKLSKFNASAKAMAPLKPKKHNFFNIKYHNKKL